MSKSELFTKPDPPKCLSFWVGLSREQLHEKIAGEEGARMNRESRGQTSGEQRICGTSFGTT